MEIFYEKDGTIILKPFVEDVQEEMVFQYFLVEGMKEALEANDYTVLEEISPSLKAIIDKHNEA